MQQALGWLIKKLLSVLKAKEFVHYISFQIAVAFEYFVRKPLFNGGMTKMKNCIMGLNTTCTLCGCHGAFR